jgi:hypothetical protein
MISVSYKGIVSKSRLTGSRFVCWIEVILDPDPEAFAAIAGHIIHAKP